MRRKNNATKYRMLSAVLAIMLMTTAVSTAAYGTKYVFASSYEQKIEEATKKKDELEQRKKDTQEKIAALEKEKNNIAAYIQQLDVQLNEITIRLDGIYEDITVTEGELEETKVALAQAKEMEQKQYDTMKKRIQYMYENGSTSALEVFLNSEGIAEFLNQMEYQKNITDYDNNLLTDYIETKEMIAKQEQLLEAKLDELAILKESAEFEQASIEQLVANKSKEIERYTEQIGISDELLFEYMDEIASQQITIEQIREEEQRRIAEELRKAEEEKKRLAEIRRQEELKRQEEAKKQEANSGQASTGTSNSVSESGMVWPLPGDHRVYSGFGYRIAPTAGASTFHRGVDIGGDMGAKIVSTLDGTVEVSTYSSTSGNYVIVNHGNGLRTAYLHCSKLLVSVGQKVKQGDVVGLVGSTGVSTAPHLHFGVSINGTYVDPKDYIDY